MEPKGLFIVLEGSDGSGKTTQFNLLKERLKAVGYNVAVFDFPRYDKPSSYFVQNYLNGRYGPASGINPYTAALFYALDRFEAAADIKKAIDAGKIVLANRYAGSNMAHQGAKFEDAVEQRSFFVWADNLEFQLLDIPRPDTNLYLRVPSEISYGLIAKKAARSYTPDKRDEHEQDKMHLKKSVATYDLLCKLFPKDFQAVECTKDGRLLSVPEINNLLWEKIKPLLPKEKPRASHSVVVTLGLNEDSPDRPKDNSGELDITFRDASLILRLHLQRSAGIGGRFAGWPDIGYEFYTPPGLSREINARYKSAMSRLAQSHQRLHGVLVKYLEAHLLTNPAADNYSVSDLLLPLTPLSALTDIKLSLKKNEIASVAAGLLASDTAELQWAAKQLYLSARQKWPADFKQPLESKDNPVPLNNIIAKLAEERLPQAFSASGTVKLLEVRPRLEFDLLAESIYPYSSLSLDEIAEEVSNWPYIQKHDSLKEAVAQPEILSKIRYKLDILSDQITLGEMIAAAGLTDVQVQAYTPRYGYEVPQIIEESLADDIYDDCFDESLKLYSQMQGSGHEDSASYAALLGHKVRWQLNADARQIKKITEDKKLAGSPAAEALMEKITEVHPLLWEIISNSKIAAAPRKNGKSRIKPYHKSAPKKKTKKKGL